MECGISPASYPETNGGSANGIMSSIRTEKSPHSKPSSLHVNFDVKEVEKRREKFLTAKYGSHQMSLIRKRLGVEMWLYDQLQHLYGCTDDSQTHDVEVDLDEVLDLEDDSQRRKLLKDLLVNAKQSPETVSKFIDELLERAKTL